MKRTFANILITVGALLSLLSGMCACAALSGNGLTGETSTWREALEGNGFPMVIGLVLIFTGWVVKRS